MTQPLQDWVLIEIEEAQQMKGSLHLPDAEKEPLRTARVLKVGPGKRHEKTGVILPMAVRPGDRVAFFMAVVQTKLGAALVHALDEGQGLIRENDIVFVIEGDVRVCA